MEFVSAGQRPHQITITEIHAADHTLRLLPGVQSHSGHATLQMAALPTQAMVGVLQQGAQGHGHDQQR